MTIVSNTSAENQMRSSSTLPFSLQKSYLINENISFINFNDLTREEALEVLQWRNNPQIRACMYRQNIISEKEHFKFLEKLPLQNKRFYWVVKEEKQYIGVVDIVDFRGENSEWGFYINPAFFGKGKAIHLLYHGLNFFFKTLKLQGLYGYCHYKNTKALLFHDLFYIHHQGYKKIALQDSKQWYSHRVIQGQDWVSQNFSLEEIKKLNKDKKTFHKEEKEVILLHQIFLEVYNTSPDLFFDLKNNTVNPNGNLLPIFLSKIALKLNIHIKKEQLVKPLHYKNILQKLYSRHYPVL